MCMYVRNTFSILFSTTTTTTAYTNTFSCTYIILYNLSSLQCSPSHSIKEGKNLLTHSNTHSHTHSHTHITHTHVYTKIQLIYPTSFVHRPSATTLLCSSSCSSKLQTPNFFSFVLFYSTTTSVYKYTQNKYTHILNV